MSIEPRYTTPPAAVSLELIFNFLCGSCGEWWSRSDMVWQPGKRVFCSNCGAESLLPEKPVAIAQATETPTHLMPPLPPLKPAVMYHLLPADATDAA